MGFSGSRNARRATVADANSIRLIQLLIGGVLLIGSVLVMIFGRFEHVEFFVGGIAIAFLATGAAVALPWHRYPFVVSALLPAAAIVAILMLRDAAPDAGFSLLWIFPAMWAG